MARLRIALTREPDGRVIEAEANLADADLPDMIAALSERYGMADASGAEVFRRWAEVCLVDTATEATRWRLERDRAAVPARPVIIALADAEEA